MKIIIESEEELLSVAADAIHVLTNLRHWTKEWEKEHGVELKNNKKHFEQRADELIAKLGSYYQNSRGRITVEIKNNEQENS
jgi:hypothetical protein